MIVVIVEDTFPIRNQRTGRFGVFKARFYTPVTVSIDFDIDCRRLANVKVVSKTVLHVGHPFWIGKPGKLGGTPLSL